MRGSIVAPPTGCRRWFTARHKGHAAYVRFDTRRAGRCAGARVAAAPDIMRPDINLVRKAIDHAAEVGAIAFGMMHRSTVPPMCIARRSRTNDQAIKIAFLCRPPARAQPRSTPNATRNRPRAIPLAAEWATPTPPIFTGFARWTRRCHSSSARAGAGERCAGSWHAGSWHDSVKRMAAFGLTGRSAGHPELASMVLARRDGVGGDAGVSERGSGEAKDYRESQADASGHGLPPTVDSGTLARQALVCQLTRPVASHMFDRRAMSECLIGARFLTGRVGQTGWVGQAGTVGRLGGNGNG